MLRLTHALPAALRLAARGLVPAALLALGPGQARAQWSTTHEQFYFPASYNWEFRDRYPSADRLFNAFDYGHSILYETLWARPTAPVSELEQGEYDFITRRLLRNPPRLPVEEIAVEPEYAKLAPEARAMFDWAHTFHRQVYDVWADESIPIAEKDARITELLGYYRSRRDLAFSSLPKSMDVMDGRFYSLVFRQRYPKFNGLIWAYHWLQVGLYEPLVVARTPAERRASVDATVRRFWQMLAAPPNSMPHLMPMTPAIAPTFARRYPEAGAIFDNLHMMHDVISDILVSREVPRSAKRQEILRAAATFRSDTAFAIPYDEWLGMGEMMGLNNMGGPAVGFGPELPTPTVSRGQSMAGMSHGAMAGMGQDAPGMPGMPGMPGANPTQGMSAQTLQAIVDRMLADPVIRERVATDPVLQRLLAATPASATSGAGMQGMQHGNMPGMGGMPQGNQGTRGATIAPSGAMPGMDHSNMPGMQRGAVPAGPSALAPGAPMTEERRQAIEFLVRLFSDPAVEGRIHADPELHRMWSDPDVQQRLRELRRAQPAPQPGQPAVPAARPAPSTPPAADHSQHGAPSQTTPRPAPPPRPPRARHQHR